MASALYWILKMKNKTPKYHSLSRRIVAQFCIFTLVLCGLYTLFSFILMYNLEDGFIERSVRAEANSLLQHYQLHQQWPSTSSEQYSLHFSPSTFPADLRRQWLELPTETEFYGDEGRHYHLYVFSELNDTYLLAEVSDKLLVRPIRDGVFFLFGLSTFSLMLFAFLIAWLLGRKTAKPLKQLADLVDDVDVADVPKKFAADFPNNEIGILAHTLETTLAQNHLALERERHFTRDVSHEMRTPIAVIKNALELLRQSNSNEQTPNVLRRIEQGAEQMELTVTTLLHLAREEHVNAQQEAVKLLPLIEAAIIDRSYLLNGKEVEVDVADNCNITVLAQPGMLKVLLDNLIGNAFQYTQLGSVQVRYEDATLIIEDTGPGIDEAISANVTQAFVKGNMSTGYGFGLSIVQRLCQHQGWQFNVNSKQGKETGTRISVVLLLPH